MRTGNILFITIDQLRADVVRGALAGFAPMPSLARLMAEGTTFANHFTVTAPCGPTKLRDPCYNDAQDSRRDGGGI